LVGCKEEKGLDMKKESVIAVIPARYGSSRFAGKPLIMIDGLSLLERTYRRVQLCPEISQCVIATDDERVARHATEFGADTVMTSASCATGTDRIAEAVRLRPDLRSASMIVNIQGDEPCVDPSTISCVIRQLSSCPSDCMATPIAPIHSEEDLTNPNVVKCVKTPSGKALYFSRHVIPGSKQAIRMNGIRYFRHIGLYAYQPEFVLQFAALPPTPLQQAEDLEMLRAIEHGFTIAVVEVARHTPDVNVPSDIEEVKRWITK
jgi:3-deoxy-manno-octulosonate cytidylyltransferase (CMP-KDO synthetase)